MGWIRDTITDGANAGYGRRDPDFGAAPGTSLAVAAPDPRDWEERLVAASERCDDIKDGLETALHGPSDPLHPDLGGAALGVVRGVVMRVLAHVIASPGKKTDG